MSTYTKIQDYVKEKYDESVNTCWIAHAKELSGINVKKAPNRISAERKNPCPSDKLEIIQEALEHFKIT